ncbi:hypothetical protein BOV89_07340 [Solemya velum gill symbiont]|uniref:TMEM143 family protein n=1 Tax=Solemya velum gill symbiont TaxID=2340 RepID=UPI000997BE95|nr:TMEM143 family protein [Solemya velum gill symbiont]OOY37506.1 hypothetical protein BOV89_07340 [Solemya velum gill symbiont]
MNEGHLAETKERAGDSSGSVALETFIPVTRFAIIDTLANEAENHGDRKEITSFFRFLGQWRHLEYQQRLLELKEHYLPFSPDRDTVKILEYSEDKLNDFKRELIEAVTGLLTRANYTHLDDDTLDKLLSTHSAHGLELKVDRSEFEETLVYYRGAGHEELQQRNWRKKFKKETVIVPTFKRLFLLLKLKSEDVRISEVMKEKNVSKKKATKIVRKLRKHLPKVNSGEHIYLKLFKNIPQEDLEMMFPNNQVRFSMFDKVKLGMTAGGGTVASVAGAATKAMSAAAASNPITLAGAFIGVIAVITRQVMNFFNTRNRYMLTLSKRLYFHSLADNRGALTLLSDRGEEEDVKEEFLLYYFLFRKPLPRNELHLLDEEIETFLSNKFNVRVDFEIEDALERLVRDEIVTLDEQEQFQTLSPSEACLLLEKKWRRQLADMNGWIPGHENEEV